MNKLNTKLQFAVTDPLARQLEALLNAREAAASLRIHPKTLLLMARAGQVPAIRFGKLWRFRASDLDRWLASRVICQHHPCR